MRLSPIALAFAALLASFSAHGGQPAGSPPLNRQPDARPPERAAEDAARDASDMLRFAPLWVPVHMSPRASDVGPPPPAASAVHAMIWQPECQEEIGLSDEQKEVLLAMNAKVSAEAREHVEQFKKLSPEARKAQKEARTGKPASWRQQLDNQVRSQIEAVLTPGQLQALKDFAFPAYVVGLLYDAEMRQQIGFSPGQEDELRRIARERLARFQAVSMEQAEKLWGMLTPEQQAELPEVVRRQGPTSAILSIAWELGFDRDHLVFSHPMLAAAPVRERLGLSAEQEEHLQVVMAECAAREERARQERLAGKTRSSESDSARIAVSKAQVEAILTPQQLTTFNEIDFRRKVALALTYPEKRERVGITAEQAAHFRRLDKETHERRYRIDREMLGQALQTLTPGQREQLREEIDRRVYGKSGTQ